MLSNKRGANMVIQKSEVTLDEFHQLFLDAIEGSQYETKAEPGEGDKPGKKGYFVYPQSFLCHLKNEYGSEQGVISYNQKKFQVKGYKAEESLLEKIAKALDKKYPNITIDLELF